MWRGLDERQTSAAGAGYLAAGYRGRDLMRADDGSRPALASGYAQIRKCRIGGFWTGVALAKRGLVDGRFRRECPCCGERHRETLFHLLVRCNVWQAARERFLGGALASVREIVGGPITGAAGDAAVVLLLGGKAEGRRVPMWAPRQRRAPEAGVVGGAPGAVSGSDDSSSDEDVNLGGGPQDASASGEAVCCSVAAFFVRMMRARAPIIRGLRSVWADAQAAPLPP